MLLRPQAPSDLASRLRERKPIGEVYAFISGLYFPGKIAYADAFASPPEGAPPALIIIPDVGLAPPDAVLDTEQLSSIGEVSVENSPAGFLVNGEVAPCRS